MITRREIVYYKRQHEHRGGRISPWTCTLDDKPHLFGNKCVFNNQYLVNYCENCKMDFSTQLSPLYCCPQGM